MKKFEIGKLFDENIKKYDEGGKFNITDSGAKLFLFLNNVSDDEINYCKTGDLRFSFVSLDDVIFFIYKIGGMQTFDCPYSIHLSNTLTSLSTPNFGEGLSLTIYLIEANTGILKSMRLVGLSNKFSCELIDEIKKQANKKFDINEYSRNINKNYLKYTTKDLDRMSKYYCKVQRD